MKVIFLFIFLITVGICESQEYNDLKKIKGLHMECEEAYKVNDFTQMKITIDQRRSFVESDKPEYISFEDFDFIRGMYYKDLGSYYSCLADVDNDAMKKAEEYYMTSLRFFKDSPIMSAPLRTELAQLSYRNKDYVKALDFLEDNYNYYSKQYLKPTMICLSQIALCKAQLGDYDSALIDIEQAIAICDNNGFYIEGRHSFHQELNRKKGKVLSLRAESKNDLAHDAVEYYKDYFEYMKDSLMVSFQKMNADERERYWLRVQPFIADCYRLEDAAADFLYDVTLFGKSILLQFSKNSPGPISPSYKDIQKKLKKNECAIEFVRYERKGDIMLGALLLHKEGTPIFIKICSEKDLLGFRILGVPAKEMFGKSLSYESRMKLIDKFYESSDFRNLIWNKEICKELKGIRKVYFSPDGPFHQLAIEYMYPRRKQISFFRLTSTRELLSENREYDFTSMFLCGGVDYYEADVCNNGSENDKQAFYLLRNKGVRFAELPGALKEVDSIRSIRDFNADTLIIGTQATEQNCCELLNKYSAVLISTHGYFSGASEKFGLDIKPRTSDLTMSSSVIILAGAMKNIWNQYFDPSEKDGILSARELSSMNLDNVGLFIVSACQSGLGYVTADGVYGIQRGLKNAGVKALVVSLWEVDDTATMHFMTSLNKFLLQYDDVQKAFDKARTEMPIEFDKPRYKNAFILIDGNLNSDIKKM